jgi:hypothetical protein
MTLTAVIVVAAILAFLEWAAPVKRMLVNLYPSGPVASIRDQ